jgi:small subunit ribosomal protein S5
MANETKEEGQREGGEAREAAPAREGGRERRARGPRSEGGGGERRGRGGDREGGGDRRREGRGGDRAEREEAELVEKLVSINRVAKVVKGGRRFGFAALVVVGDGRGRVGYGSGKAREVPEAIRKATDQAKRGLIRVPLREARTLHHDVTGRFGAGSVVLRAAPQGTGIIAGGPTRAVFEALGIQDVVAKSTGTSNPHNMIKATFAALQAMSNPRMVAARRGKKVADILGIREEKETVDA